MHAFKTSTEEAETDGSFWDRDQPSLQELNPEEPPKPQRNPVSKKPKINKQINK